MPAEGTDSLTRHGFDYAYRATFTWPDLAWLCAHTTLPVILKGVMTADDADEAVECGVAAVYVSNHGGRMVDQAVSTIEMLAEIVEAVGPRRSGHRQWIHPRGGGMQGAWPWGHGRWDRDFQCWALALGAPGSRGLEILEQEISSTMAAIWAAAPSPTTPATSAGRSPRGRTDRSVEPIVQTQPRCEVTELAEKDLADRDPLR